MSDLILFVFTFTFVCVSWLETRNSTLVFSSETGMDGFIGIKFCLENENLTWRYFSERLRFNHIKCVIKENCFVIVLKCLKYFVSFTFSFLNKLFGRNIVAQQLLDHVNNQQWFFFYFENIFRSLKIIIRSKIQ